jgi:DNA end-binding protein Ku
VHEASGTRVRQALWRDSGEELDTEASAAEEPEPEKTGSDRVIQFPAQPQAVEVSRSELAKGYEYEPGRFVVLNRDEMESITPRTAHEMQILEFVKLAEVDPTYFETSYYAAPDKGGERAYALLLEALRRSGLVGIAQVAMHRREHVVVIRPGQTGIVLHTMFYESEVRRENEYRTDISQVATKELDLALLLVKSLTAVFEPSKYRDSYREKLDALIAAKLEGLPARELERPRAAPVVNILEALQRSLQPAQRKPPAGEAAAEPQVRKTKSRAKRAGASRNEATASARAGD